MLNYENNTMKFARTASQRLFADGNLNSEDYAVYTNVPVNCINSVKKGVKKAAVSKNCFGATGKEIIDIVFCVGKEIALCVLFNPDTVTAELFNGPLHGITVISPSHSYCTDAFADYVKATLSRYASKSADKYVKFELEVYPVNILITKRDGESVNGALMRTRIIDENFEITDFGIACGVMCCFSSGKAKNKTIIRSFKISKYSCDVFTANRYFNMPHFKNKEQLLPLKDKLKRVELGIPCDETYAKILAQRLKAFLDKPLSEIMANKKAIYFQLRGDIENAVKLIRDTAGGFPLPESIVTYGELMNFLYRMNKLADSERYGCEDLRLRFSDIIVSLGNFVYSGRQNISAGNSGAKHNDLNTIRKMSLKKQLDSVCGESGSNCSAFSMLSGHYCYAASLLAGSNYANWLYRESVLKDPSFGLDSQYPPSLKRSVAGVLSDARYIIFQNINDQYEATDTLVELIFDLLVLPVADINKIRNINSQRNERRHKYAKHN